MIRVNLLPIRQARRRSAGRTQLFVFAALIIAELAVLGLFYVIYTSELDRLNERVAQNEQEVEAAKEAVKDAEKLEKQKQQYTQQLSVLNELEKKRTGPVRVLDELQSILSPPRNEEDRFAQLQKNWNVDWDPQRLWIQNFSETSGKFNMSGTAVNADDVAEFLQRLHTAEHFTKVELEVVQAKTTGGGPGGKEARTVSFKLHGQLVYNPTKTDASNKKGS